MLRWILQWPRRLVWAGWRRIDPVGFWRHRGARIGDRCLFGRSVDLGTEPYLITHDGGVWVFRDERPAIDVFGPIKIGDNTYLGWGVTVLPGVTIGANCVIGAGAVVSRSIPDNSVAVGVPARVIRTLDEYRKKTFAEAVEVRGMNRAERREHLVRLFVKEEDGAAGDKR